MNSSPGFTSSSYLSTSAGFESRPLTVTGNCKRSSKRAPHFGIFADRERQGQRGRIRKVDESLRSFDRRQIGLDRCARDRYIHLLATLSTQRKNLGRKLVGSGLQTIKVLSLRGEAGIVNFNVIEAFLRERHGQAARSRLKTGSSSDRAISLPEPSRTRMTGSIARSATPRFDFKDAPLACFDVNTKHIAFGPFKRAVQRQWSGRDRLRAFDAVVLMWQRAGPRFFFRDLRKRADGEQQDVRDSVGAL